MKTTVNLPRKMWEICKGKHSTRCSNSLDRNKQLGARERTVIAEKGKFAIDCQHRNGHNCKLLSEKKEKEKCT